MKVWIFADKEDKKVMVSEEENGIIIYTLGSVGLVNRKYTTWAEIDRLKNEGKIEYVTTIKTFHKPWAELFDSKF